MTATPDQTPNEALREALKTVAAECHADLEGGVECRCEDYGGGDFAMCLPHRVLATLAGLRDE